jgi:hypothetical protein
MFQNDNHFVLKKQKSFSNVKIWVGHQVFTKVLLLFGVFQFSQYEIITSVLNLNVQENNLTKVTLGKFGFNFFYSQTPKSTRS